MEHREHALCPRPSLIPNLSEAISLAVVLGEEGLCCAPDCHDLGAPATA